MLKFRILVKTGLISVAAAFFISMTALAAGPQGEVSYISTASDPLLDSPQGKQIGTLEVATELKKRPVKNGWVEVQVWGWVRGTAVEVRSPKANPSGSRSPDKAYLMGGSLLKVPGKTWTSIGTIEAGTAIERLEKRGDWIRVEVRGWVRSSSLTDDLKETWGRALELYQDQCDPCHQIQPSQFSAREWPDFMKSMVPQTSLTKKESALLLKWLQRSTENPAR